MIGKRRVCLLGEEVQGNFGQNVGKREINQTAEEMETSDGRFSYLYGNVL